MPQKKQKEETQCAISVGQQLKECRENKKLSLDSVSEHLCITKTNLASLENDSEALERNVYTIGFIRSYANYLGMNSEEMARQFKESTGYSGVKNISPDYDFLKPMPRSGVPKSRSIVLSLLLLGLIGLIVYHGSQEIASNRASEKHGDGFVVSEVEEDASILPLEGNVKEAIKENKDQDIRQVSAVEGESPAAELKTADAEPKAPSETQLIGDVPQTVSEATADTEEVKPAVLSVKIIAKENTWVELRNSSGRVVYDKIMHSGESQDVSDPGHMIMTTGNAAGVELIVGDKKIEKLGDSGQVKRNISLDPEKVLAEFTVK